MEKLHVLKEKPLYARGFPANSVKQFYVIPLSISYL
jgi:hypothetical protein